MKINYPLYILQSLKTGTYFIHVIDTLPVASYTKLKGFLPNRKQMNAKVFI